MRRGLCALTAFSAIALSLAPSAGAGGGNYRFAGGDRAQRTQVHNALEASRFNWNLVHETITIHIERGITSHSMPGEIWLDSDLLNAGTFSWATVQDEYAHQIDFFLFNAEMRAQLEKALGGHAWCYEDPSIQAHSAQGCERFSSVLPWAYWQSSENAYRPTSRRDESAAMPPQQFRQLMTRLLTTERTTP